MEFQMVQNPTSSPAFSEASSNLPEFDEDKEAFDEYVKGGEYNVETDTYFSTFGFHR